MDLTGLLKDDTHNETYLPLYKEAIRRMPEVLQNERNFRLTKALDLSTKRIILPEEEWTKYEEVSIPAIVHHIHCRFILIRHVYWYRRDVSLWTTNQGCMIRVATCQGNVWEKTKFSPGQGKVREFWKNVREFCYVMSGNCHGILSWHYF